MVWENIPFLGGAAIRIVLQVVALDRGARSGAPSVAQAGRNGEARSPQGRLLLAVVADECSKARVDSVAGVPTLSVPPSSFGSCGVTWWLRTAFMGWSHSMLLPPGPASPLQWVSQPVCLRNPPFLTGILLFPDPHVQR